MEPDDAKDIGHDVSLYIGSFHVLNERECHSDTGVGDDDVKVINALFLKLLDSREGISFLSSITLDDDELGTLGCGDLRQGSGRRHCGIAVGCDDGMVRLCKIELEQTLAQPTVGATD